MQLRNDLSKSFNIDLPSTIVFDYPTPSALAKWIAQVGFDSNGTAANEVLKNKKGSSKPASGNGQAQSLEAILRDVAASVSAIIGTEVSNTEPLMAAGLDSLGKSNMLCAQSLKIFKQCLKTMSHFIFRFSAIAKHIDGTIRC